MPRQIRLVTCSFLFVLALLAACSDQPTPTPPGPGPTTAVPASPTPLSTATPEASSTPTAEASPTETAVASATAVPTVPAVPTLTPTVTPRPSPTSAPVVTPTPLPVTPPSQVTPLPIVPLQPVRRAGGTLPVGVLDSDLKAHSFLPYASDLSEVSRHLQSLTWNAGLIYLDPVKLEWKPLAAKALPTVDLDGRRLTFQLRTDIFWSDGSPILATDYIFAFNSALKETRYPHLADLQHIRSVEGPNNQTLVFTFDDRYATMFETIKLIEPLPEKVWRVYPFSNPDRNPEINRPSVVSGPYLPDATAQNFTPTTNYFLGRANFDKISLISVRSQAELIAGLKAGSLGWTFNNLTAASISDLQTSNGLTVYRWTPQDAGQRYLAYNLSTPFLQDEVIRLALNRTLDVRSLIASLERGMATEQTSFLPANNEYALKQAAPGRFNMLEAQKALKASGYYPRDSDGALADLGGKAIPALDLIYLDSSPESASLAVYIQQQYKQVGLAVNLNKLDQATYTKRRLLGQYDLEVGLLKLPGALDPDDFKAMLTSDGSLNFTGYANDTVDALFAQALRLSDPAQKDQRRQLYNQLQQIITNDSPVFFLYTLQSSTVMSNGVDPGVGGLINLPRWQLAWDAFPALLNWYQRGTA